MPALAVAAAGPTTFSRWWAPVGAVGALAAATLYTAVRDPYQPGFFPPCIFLASTGHYCPGCGGLRATHELANGNLAAALDMNPVVVLVIIPLAALGLGWWLLRTAGVKVPPLRLSTGMAWALPASLFAFWIIRNLPPLAPYLSP